MEGSSIASARCDLPREYASRMLVRPCTTFRRHHALMSAAISTAGFQRKMGQAKRAFGDKRVASHQLECLAGRIGLGLVIAREDPHFPPMYRAAPAQIQAWPDGMKQKLTPRILEIVSSIRAYRR